jgi:hypothetical protein
VIVHAGAAVDHENARPLAGTIRIEGKHAMQSRVAIPVDDRFSLQSHRVPHCDEFVRERMNLR